MAKNSATGIVVTAAIMAAGLLCAPNLALPQAPHGPSTPLTYVEAKTIVLGQAFRTKRDWHVTAYKPQGDDAETGDLPVKICFWFELSRKDEDCTSIGGKEYPHQNLTEFSIVPLVKSSQPLLGVLVETFFSGGGSGIARTTSISTYDKNSDEFFTTASIDLNEISEYKMISSGSLSGSILTASGLWQQDEGHFSAHRFWIQVYRYSEYYGRYEKLIGYLTLKKYPSEQIRVLEIENSTISGNIAKVYGGKDPLSGSIGPPR